MVKVSGEAGFIQYYLTQSHTPCIAEISASSPIFKFYEKGVINDIAMSKKGLMNNQFICSQQNLDHPVLIIGWGSDSNKYDSEYLIIKNSFG